MFHVIEKYRITKGALQTDSSFGNNGAFSITRVPSTTYIIIASDGAINYGDPCWEHISVHVVNNKNDKERTPTWTEMCFIKNLFWDEEDWVVQFHPAKSQYINHHLSTLHLWRPVHEVMPTPPKEMVG